MTLSKEEYRDGLVNIGKLVFDFAKVHRARYHDDGVTLESDTDHTVMVAVIACTLADTFYKEDLDIGKVAQFAIVHDLVEAYVGDTDTFGITTEKRKEKDHREKRALHMMEDKFITVYPWIPKTISDYEKKESKEAKFVKTVDKMMTLITHILNKGAYFKKKRMPREEALAHFNSKLSLVKSDYGKEFTVLHSLMKELLEEAFRKSYD